MKRLRAGIIGLGVGEKHIQAYERHPACEVVTLCDFSDEKLSKASKKYPEMKLVKNADEILDDLEINVVSIASLDEYHFEQAAKSIKNGKHIFVEKPLCLHPFEAIQLRNFLRENPQIKMSSNLNLRTCPRFKWLKNAIMSGQMGRVYYIEGDYLWGRLHKLTKGWRKDMPFYSIINGAAVHMIDLILWLSGKNPVEVKGYGNQIASLESEFKFNDFAVILIKFQDGMVAKVSANGGCVHPHFHRLFVYGTKKTFIHDMTGAILIDSNDPHAKVQNINEEYPGKEKGDMIYSFLDSILHNDKEAIITSDDVFTTMSVCFAAEKAIKEGSTVKIEFI
jgi:predicted dehydrogenase